MHKVMTAMPMLMAIVITIMTIMPVLMLMMILVLILAITTIMLVMARFLVSRCILRIGRKTRAGRIWKEHSLLSPKGQQQVEGESCL